MLKRSHQCEQHDRTMRHLLDRTNFPQFTEMTAAHVDKRCPCDIYVKFAADADHVNSDTIS